jgi:hypothetical protein
MGAAALRDAKRKPRAMSSRTLSLEIACTRDEAARFAAVELFLADLASDPAAQPPGELDAVFGANAKRPSSASSAIPSRSGSPAAMTATPAC